MSVYGKVEARTVTESASRINEPYIGGAKLLNVSKIDGEKNGNPWEALDFEFQATEGRMEGATYTKREFNVREDDPKAQEKAQNQIDRLVYMLSYFTEGDREEATQPIRDKVNALIDQNPPFGQLADLVIAIANDLNYQAKDDLRMKINGDVYQGRPQLGFNLYIGFLADERSEGPLTFSNQEKQKNAKYMAFQSAPATTGVEDASSSGWEF